MNSKGNTDIPLGVKCKQGVKGANMKAAKVSHQDGEVKVNKVI